MNIFRLIAVISALAAAVAANAQMRIIPREQVEEAANPKHSSDSALLRFDSRHIMAEPMNEDDAPMSFAFAFRNVGNEELSIVRLVTTCSCVTASCDTETVPPGAEAKIIARYDPKGHPGRFDRKIFVYTGSGDAPAAVLTLSVQVENGKDLSGMWPVQIGGIRMRTSEIAFLKGRKAVERLSFINLTGKPLALGCEDAFLPGYISFSTDPEVVAAGEEGEIVISYEPSSAEEKNNVKIMLKGLGLPPSRSSITVIIKD